MCARHYNYDVLKPFHDLAELERVITQCHNLLRNEKPHLLDAFDEFSKILFAKIYDEIRVAIGADLEHKFQTLPGQPAERNRKEITSLFNQANIEFPDVFGDDLSSISLRASTVSKVIDLLQGYSILSTPLDIKGAAYEVFLKSALPVGKIVGQFFTPREVVDFAVNVIDPLPSESVVDPACGSGGFLIAALERAWHHIDKSSSGNKSIKAKRSFVSRNLFGMDIDPRMVRLAMMNLLIHGNLVIAKTDRRGQITCHNGLIYSNKIKEMKVESKHVVLTNPPFGSIESDMDILSHFKLGHQKTSRASPILFLERCLQLLAPGGKMAIVLPDPILNGASASDVRELVRQEAIVQAVVKLPSETFLPYGSSAESSLLFLTKKKKGLRQGNVFMAEAKFVGYNRLGGKIPKNDLIEILSLWRRFKTGKRIQSSKPIAFSVSKDKLVDRLDVRRYWHPLCDQIHRALAVSPHSVKPLRKLVKLRREMVVPSRENPQSDFRYIGLGNIEPLTGRIVYDESGEERRGRMRLFRTKTLGAEIKGSCQRISPGDVLFGKLRPYLRKVLVVPPSFEDGICSHEFLVMRPNPQIDAEFLAYLLRSDIVIHQLAHLYSGLGRPRISVKEILDVEIPIPSNLKLQKRVARQLRTRERKALQKRLEGKKLLEKAKMELKSLNSSLIKTLNMGRKKTR